MKATWRLGAWILAGAFLLAPVRETRAASPEARVFLLTSTYGVMAGSLTGLASLAFYSSPSEHMRNVAMGASLGLYTGIILGAYLLYALPDPSKPKSSAPAPKKEEPASDPENPLGLQSSLDTSPEPRLSWMPLVAPGAAGNPQIGVALFF